MPFDEMPPSSPRSRCWPQMGSALFMAGVALLAALWVPVTLAAGTTRYVTTSGTNSGDCTTPNPCRTLSYALAQSTSGDEIQVAAGIYTDSVTFDRDATVVGSGAGTTIIQANARPGVATFRVFTVTAGSTVTVTGITVRHGRVTSLMDGGRGGGAWVAGRLTLIDSVVGPNKAQQGGGLGLNHIAGHIVLSNTQVVGNYSDKQGGGIFVFSGTLEIQGGGVVSNISSGEIYNFTGAGGGICLYTIDAVLTQTGDTLIASNQVLEGWHGGAGINITSGRANLDGAIVAGNVITGGYGGAAIYLYGENVGKGADLVFNHGFIENNRALGTDTSGGGVHLAGRYTHIQMADTHVIGNYAIRGGGVYVAGGQASISDSLLVRNTVVQTGGAALARNEEGMGVLTITNSCLFGNSDTAVVQQENGVTINVESNWWGAPDGPGGAGGGSGDSVGAGIDFTPYLTQPLAPCTMAFLPVALSDQ